MIIKEILFKKFPKFTTDFQQIDELYKHLSLETLKPHNKKIQKKEAFEIMYLNSIKPRIDNLIAGTLFLFNEENFTGACIMHRSVIESICVIGYILNCRKKPSYDKKFKKIMLGGKDGSIPVESINVMDLIRETDKFIIKGGYDGLKIEKIYDFLSEYTHPNALGTLNLYLDLLEFDENKKFIIHLNGRFDENLVSFFVNGLIGTLLICEKLIKKSNEWVDALPE